jgi:ribonuclease M5
MKAVFIVEGLKDREQIQKAFEGNEDVITLVTEGTKINNRIRLQIEYYLVRHVDVYILSDPDEAGEQLADMIQSWYPVIPRIEVDIEECGYFTGKRKKAGIEYSSYKYLKKLLSPYLGLEYVEEESPICWD